VAGDTITASGENQNFQRYRRRNHQFGGCGRPDLHDGAAEGQFNGTAAAADTDTGGYRSGANEYSVAAGGVQIIKVSSAGIDVKTGTVLIAGVAAFPVPTAQIADDAITYAKIQNVSATARLLGRTTAGAGDIEEISLGSGLSFVAGVLTPGISAALVPNYLSGLTLSTAGGSATMSIAAGVANDSTNTVLMNLASAIGKTTSSWAVGTGNGGLDTGAIATGTWYHFYEIERPDTGVVDALFSLSATAPTMPANYTLKRRIGSGLTNGSSQWVLFQQNGDEFLWDTPVKDIDVGTIGTSAATQTLASVPTGVIVDALGNIAILNAAANQALYLSALSTADLAASNTVAPGATIRTVTGGTNEWHGRFQIRTNTSAQFRARADAASTTFRFVTLGWIDPRGK
jgi:hypothetical protein